MKILVGVPAYNHQMFSDVTSAMLEFQQAIIEHKDQAGFLFISSPILPNVRNRIAEAAINGGFDYLLFWDADVRPHNAKEFVYDFIAAMKEKKAPICAGNYRIKKPNHDEILFASAKDLGGFKYENYTSLPNEVIEADYVPAGLMLINVTFLKMMPPPWFQMVESGNPSEPMPEDWWFCRRARKEFGAKVLLDCRHGIDHFGVSTYPYVPKTT